MSDDAPEVFRHTDIDGDTLIVYADGTAELISARSISRRKVALNRHVRTLRVFGSTGPVYPEPGYRGPEELQAAIEVAIAAHQTEDPAATDEYYERKADQGKPRMSLIPWEAWANAGAERWCWEALRRFQDDRFPGNERGWYEPALLDVISAVPVLEFGARKYSENSWRTVPNAANRYRDAMCRHEARRIGAFGYERQVLDEESGLPHTAHRDCCALFLYALLEAE